MTLLCSAELRRGNRGGGVAPAARCEKDGRSPPCRRTRRPKTSAITRSAAASTRLVNKSTDADLRATKMLIDMLKDVEKKAGVAPPPEPAPFTAADEEVMAIFIARLRQAWEEELRQKGTEDAGSSPER